MNDPKIITVDDFRRAIDAAITSDEPYRSARLGLLAQKIRTIAWQGTVRGQALELAARAEQAIDPGADTLAGLFGETGQRPALHGIER